MKSVSLIWGRVMILGLKRNKVLLNVRLMLHMVLEVESHLVMHHFCLEYRKDRFDPVNKNLLSIFSSFSILTKRFWWNKKGFKKRMRRKKNSNRVNV